MFKDSLTLTGILLLIFHVTPISWLQHLQLHLSIQWMWRCHISPFCAWGMNSDLIFPQIMPRSVPEVSHLQKLIHSSDGNSFWLQEHRPPFFYFRQYQMYSHSRDSFCQLRKWGIKILLCFLRLSIQHTNGSFRDNGWRRFSDASGFQQPRMLLHRGAEHSSGVIREVGDRWFQISLSPTPGLQPQHIALMGTLLNQLEEQVPDFTLNQAAT